ncbi:MAG: DUF1634 domain-containing protein [Methanomassiliicoccus sp.]|nr:DUF1634 domain-containing protein [Methanomassiliicoccus sp.]
MHIVLRAGMVLSLSVLLLGLVLFALSPADHQAIDLSPAEIIPGLLEGSPIAVIDLGILLLIATPLTRVLTAMAVFAVDREPRFVLLSLTVLAVIAAGVLLS